MKKIALILVSISVLMNCSKESNHLVSGNIQTLGSEINQKVYVYELKDKSLVPIDSAMVDSKGDFKIEISNSKNGFFLFGSSFENTLPLVFNENSNHIELTITNNQQYSINYEVKGSEATKQMALFYEKVYGMMMLNQELTMKSQRLGPNNMEGQQVLQQQLMAASEEFVAFRNQYIKNNKGSEALLVAIEQIRPDSEMGLLKEIVEDLNQTMPNSPFVKNLNENLDKEDAKIQKREKQEKLNNLRLESKLPIGGEAPELEFQNPKGKNIQLSSLRGKVVLIDFWAAWCRPCRAENPNVVRIYNKYKEKGFDVFSVSLDENKEKWIQAIEKDGLVWENHVSDLLGWKSKAVEIYGFNSIPFTVLIDRNGKIIDRNLRGNDLEEAINKAL